MGKAARLFNGSGEETLHNRITPSAEQRDFLQTQWNAIAEHLKVRLPAKYEYPVSTWIQGSYKFGTLIKPVHLREEYDVDVGVYFEWKPDGNATPAAKQLREWVQTELQEYKKLASELKEVEEPPLERCSRAVYARQFHIDTPVYHLEPEKDRRRLACWSDKWEDSDPKAIYKWFKSTVSEGNRDQLRRLVRYLKAWAAVSFDDIPNSRPSSILLSVLVAQAFNDVVHLPYISYDDDDAVIEVVRKIHARLLKDGSVRNPVNKSENLNRLSAEAWQGFLARFQVLRDCADRATDADDEVGAALAWADAFSFLMPLPETDQVEVVEKSSGKAVMQLPEIDIEVYARGPKKLVNRYSNDVVSVPKDCDLVFTITNPHIIPQFATVEWTVRNSGKEADAVGDLGHRRIGLRMLSAEEKTSYAGRHFMDCIVRANGHVYAVRRVPVNIIDLRYPVRNPPRPAYTKIRSLIRRH